jgi:EAL domain-containing protein (putative c-di-GMP-specific phosphodiesterase class I)
VTGQAPPFGPDAADLLARALPLLGPEGAIMGFYEDAGGMEPPGGNGTTGSPDRDGELGRRHSAHLRAVLEPGCERDALFESARLIGRLHARAGFGADRYAAAARRYERRLLEGGERIDARDRAALDDLLCERLCIDLQGVLRGYGDAEANLARALMLLGIVVSQAATVSDLAEGVLEALCSIDGIASGFFGRPDERGDFQFEVGTGVGVADYIAATMRGPAPITTVPGRATSHGPSGRAWHSRTIERSDSYTTDPSTAPWHEIGRRLGWHASAAIPLFDATGESRAMINLYATWPGYFAHPDRAALLAHVQSLVGPPLQRLEVRNPESASVSPWGARVASTEGLSAGRIEMRYQPVIDLPSGRLLKLEALARMRDGNELLTPSRFLPALGERDLTRLLTIALDQALASLAEWESGGLSTGVSVNVPAFFIADARCVAIVDAALARHGIAPSRLTLELLETGAAEIDEWWPGRCLHDLRALGVRIAQDDLGAGHSSLMRLKSIPFDEIKIDRRLTRGAEDAPREGLGFIHPLVNLARSLGMRVIVEGIERQGLIEAAALLGADAGQGYAISRPMRADEVPAWAARFRLDLDPSRPLTPLGALAGHLAWEERLSAIRWGRADADPDTAGPCPLAPYIAGANGRAPELEAAHRALHAMAVDAPGGEAHRAAWESLVTLLRESTTG